MTEPIFNDDETEIFMQIMCHVIISGRLRSHLFQAFFWTVVVE